MARIIEAAANAALDAALALVNAGTGDNGTVQFRTGSAPTNVHDSPTGTLLVEIDLSGTAFGSADDGVAEANGLPLSDDAVETGEIGYARVHDANGDPVFDEDDVGTSGNAIVVNTTSVSSGAPVTITAFTVSQPFN